MKKEKEDNHLEDVYDRMAAFHPKWGKDSREQMERIRKIIDESNKNLDEILSWSPNPRGEAARGGYLAEEIHAETFNLDAELKGNKSRAITDRYDEWNKYGEGKNSEKTDILIVRDGKVMKKYQSKYCRDAQSTADAFHNPKYRDNDGYLAPSDQQEGIKERFQESIDKNAKRGGDPQMRQEYRTAQEKVTDTISDGKSSSRAMTKDEAMRAGKGDLEDLIRARDEYKSKSTLIQSGNAAVRAGSMTALSSGCRNAFKYIMKVRRGEISEDEALQLIITETACAAADTAVKSAANAAAQSMIARYSSKELVRQALARQGMGALLSANMVTTGVNCGIDAIKDLIKLGAGKISAREFSDRNAKNLLTASAGTVGGAAGASSTAALAGSLGFEAGSVGMVAAEIIGGAVGALISGIAAKLIIENGVEKPHRDAISNTEALARTEASAFDAAVKIRQGQRLYAHFLDAAAGLENSLTNRKIICEKLSEDLDDALSSARTAIRKIWDFRH